MRYVPHVHVRLLLRAQGLCFAAPDLPSKKGKHGVLLLGYSSCNARARAGALLPAPLCCCALFTKKADGVCPYPRSYPKVSPLEEKRGKKREPKKGSPRVLFVCARRLSRPRYTSMLYTRRLAVPVGTLFSTPLVATLRTRAATAAGVVSTPLAHSSAAAPATCGALIDVPLCVA